MAPPQMSLTLTAEDLYHHPMTLRFTDLSMPPTLCYEPSPMDGPTPAVVNANDDFQINFETAFESDARIVRLTAVRKKGHHLAHSSENISVSRNNSMSETQSATDHYNHLSKPTTSGFITQPPNFEYQPIANNGDDWHEYLDLSLHQNIIPAENDPILDMSPTSLAYTLRPQDSHQGQMSPQVAPMMNMNDLDIMMALQPSPPDLAATPNMGLGFMDTCSPDTSRPSTASTPNIQSLSNSTDPHSSHSPDAENHTNDFSDTAFIMETGGFTEMDDDPSNGNGHFVCDVKGCGRVCRRKNTLRMHRKTHDTKKTPGYPCPVAGCNQTFSRRHDRTRHEVYQHDRVCEWTCDQCHRFFQTEINYNRHTCRAQRQSVHFDGADCNDPVPTHVT